MGYEAYKPEILAKKLMTDRHRNCVFKNLMYKGPIIGEITKKGDVLHIAGTGRPTIRDYVKGTPITRETKATYNQELHITEQKYFDFEVERIDNVQAQGEIFSVEIGEAKEALGRTMDEFLAGFYTQAGQTVEQAQLKSTNIISTLTEVEQKLLEKDVPLEEEKFLVVTPAVYAKMVMGKIVFQQSNKDVFGKGFKGSYLNFTTFVSNSIQESGDVDYCMAFSRQAIALAEQIPISTIERYKPHDGFTDAFKGLHLYGGTVIRPGELVRLDLTPAAETGV